MSKWYSIQPAKTHIVVVTEPVCLQNIINSQLKALSLKHFSLFITVTLDYTFSNQITQLLNLSA